jgi:N-methylhydantoinase A
MPRDLSGLPEILEDFRADGIEAIAVCLLHSYANPAHEQAVLERDRGGRRSACWRPSHSL